MSTPSIFSRERDLFPFAPPRVRCRKHAFARSDRFVGADSPSLRPKCWSEPVNYETATPNASEGLVHRYYDPTTDQFLSIDPRVTSTGQPYAFTGDDPLNATDPLGLRWFYVGDKWNWYTGHKYDYLCGFEQFTSHCGGPSGYSQELAKARAAAEARSSTALPSGASPTQFAMALLFVLAVAQTKANVNIILAWERQESGNDWNTFVPQPIPTKFNPLNATQSEPGSINSVGPNSPQIYQDWQTGLEGASTTLLANDDGYPAILQELAYGNHPFQVFLAIVGSSWGTRNDFYSYYGQGYDWTQVPWNQS